VMLGVSRLKPKPAPEAGKPVPQPARLGAAPR
jgi:hypothetical protein